MRTFKVNIEGVEEFEVQIATGKKAIEIMALTEKMRDAQNPTADDMEHDLNIMCEIIAKCTKYSKDEAFETFNPREIGTLVKGILGDKDEQKKIQA